MKKYNLNKLILIKIKTKETVNKSYFYHSETKYDRWWKRFLFEEWEGGIYFSWSGYTSRDLVDYKGSIEEFNKRECFYYDKENNEIFDRRYVKLIFDEGYNHTQYFETKQLQQDFLNKLQKELDFNLYNLAQLI